MRRQTALAERWCKENGHTLDMSLSFADEGVSGWSGANAKTGALAAILKLTADGKLGEGTILLVEALDRLTRQDLTIAVPLLIQIVNSGITVITLQDNKAWSKESMRDMADFMLSVLMLARGHEESQRKSQLVRAAFEANRQSGSQQIFGTAPGWLSREDKTQSWVVDAEKAESVKKVFELAAAGYGSPSIASKANAEGWPVPTRLGNKAIGKEKDLASGKWHGGMPGYAC